MIEVKEQDADLTCPYCGAFLKVEDSDDFEGGGRMERNESFWMTCPKCEMDMLVDVQWEPTYTSVTTEAQHQSSVAHTQAQAAKAEIRTVVPDRMIGSEFRDAAGRDWKWYDSWGGR